MFVAQTPSLRRGRPVALSASADGVAAADPLPVADVTQSADTDDGWHLSAALTRMTINSVPNMAATAFTREGFVTGKAAATIDGNGAVAVNSGTLVIGLQLGCQVDLSEGGSVGGGRRRRASAPASDGGNVFNSHRSVRRHRRQRVDQPAARNHHEPRAGQEGSSRAAPVRSSCTTRTSRWTRCGGQVSVRFFATAMIDTDKSDDSVNVYGDILSL